MKAAVVMNAEPLTVFAKLNILHLLKQVYCLKHGYKENFMAKASVLNQQISDQVKGLPDKEKQEVLNFIEYLKFRGDRLFIDYVNTRTKSAVGAKKRGEHFSSLEELQQEYA